MVKTRRLFERIALLASCTALCLSAHAVSITQSGTLANDNTVVDFNVTTTTTQTFNFYTTSYNGGINADGTTTVAGGFDPLLSLFNADGTIFAGNATSNGGEDASLTDVLGPGSYILALTEFPNYSNGTLSSFPGIGTIVSDACGANSPAFTDAVTCNQLNGNYTVNISSAPVGSTAVTPEPPSALLLLLPLGGVVFLHRRKLGLSASL